MSCSRVSWFFAATCDAAERGAPCRRAPRGRPARGRRRSRPRPRTPRRGRRRCASCARRSAAAGRPRTRRAWSRRSGWWRGAGRRARRGRLVGVRADVVVARPARPAPRRPAIASSSRATTCGKASRKKPEMRTVTSIRGRPSSATRHDLEAGDPARGVVPHRPAAEQRQHLGDVVALGAHRRGAPHGQADRRAGTRRCRRGAGRAASRRAPGRRPRRCATGSPWGRRSRSCGRSAAR